MRSRPAVLIALLIALLLGGGSIYTLVKSSTDPDSGHGRGTFDPTANSEEGNPDDDDVGNEFSIDPNSSSDGETGEGESPTSAEPDSPPDPNALAEASSSIGSKERSSPPTVASFPRSRCGSTATARPKRRGARSSN